ncbi:MAG: CDP-alcohol phosphatidyltransferase family protein [Dehalococcoidia bacterium]|jgi:CDP-diacylglycerol--glycerol-3-phosphate 3-phosphatidyltransferase|nr:CDP-alcohol phosphatidyltransferase family protein [Dehalococcoidia bacterium]
MSFLISRRALERRLHPLLLALARLGVHPHMLTVAGVTGNLVAAVLVGRGHELLGGILVWGASAMDMLDGALARAAGRQSPFGSVLDAVMDRVAEAAVLFAVLFRFSSQGDQEGVLLAFVAAVASFMVSYVRARAELAGVPMREGLMARPERVFLLGLGLIIGHVKTVLWVISVLAAITAAQRFLLAWARTIQRRGGHDPS